MMTDDDSYKVREEMTRPCVVWKPRVFIDGNKWCALYGESLQDGVAGFGDSPSDAMFEFDRAWYAKLPPENKEKNDGQG